MLNPYQLENDARQRQADRLAAARRDGLADGLAAERRRRVAARLLFAAGSLLVRAGAALRARYDEPEIFADEGAPEGAYLLNLPR